MMRLILCYLIALSFTGCGLSAAPTVCSCSITDGWWSRERTNSWSQAGGCMVGSTARSCGTRSSAKTADHFPDSDNVTFAAPLAATSTGCSVRPVRSCHATSVYLPGGLTSAAAAGRCSSGRAGVK